MTTLDAEGRERRGVYLPAELWDFVDGVARRDEVSRSDFIEGLVLLAMDEAEPACPHSMTTPTGLRGVAYCAMCGETIDIPDLKGAET